jgi:2-iminobutanoate/2-iminopropanoate deaminase
MKQTILLLITCISFHHLSAQQTQSPLQKEKWHWDNPNKQDTSAGYSEAVKVGNVLYISGKVAREVNEEGIKRVYTALEQALKHYGLTFQYVVKENLYTTDMEAMKKYNYVRKEFYKNDFPAADCKIVYARCKTGGGTDCSFPG